MSRRSAFLSNNNLYSTDPQCGRSWNQACKSDWQDGGYASEQECRKDCKNSFRSSPAMAASFQVYDYGGVECDDQSEDYEKCVLSAYNAMYGQGSSGASRSETGYSNEPLNLDDYPSCPPSSEDVLNQYMNGTLDPGCLDLFGQETFSSMEEYGEGCGYAQAGNFAKYMGVKVPPSKNNADKCSNCQWDEMYPSGNQDRGLSAAEACTVYDAPPSAAPSSSD